MLENAVIRAIKDAVDAVHDFDERVNLESVRQNTQAMTLFIAEWRGLEEI